MRELELLVDLAEKLGLLFGHLEQLEQIARLPLEALEVVDGCLGGRALAHQTLRFLSIIPKAFAEAQVRKAIDSMLQTVEVKDTSGAPRGAR